MVSLHFIVFNTKLIFYWYLIFSNIINALITFLFILFIVSILVCYPNILKTINYYLNILKVGYLWFLLVSFILYLVKFIGHTFILHELLLLNMFSSSVKLPASLYTVEHTLGDVVVLLCIMTTFISWVYLSERSLFLNNFNIYYFYIFIIFTINMVYTNNLLVMFIFFELIFLPSIYFVYILGYSKKVDKTIKYLLNWTLSGSFIVLCGLVYLYSISKTLVLTELYWIRFSWIEGSFLFCLFFFGFGIKIPLWPLHYWLTKVHVEAPTGFSIFLSGYLVKTAFFCLTYFCVLFCNPFFKYIVLGIIFWGALDASFRMWTSTDIKRLIAFATIQEMNLIVGLFFLLSNTQLQILNLFLLVHGVLSALFFFLVDQIQKRYQTRNLVCLSGLAYKLPILHVIIWVSILVFRGFPIFIKFFIEWELLAVLLTTFNVGGFLLFLLINMYGVLGFCRVWLSILYGQPGTQLVVTFDILRKDLYLGVSLLGLLTFLCSLVFFF